MLKNAEGAAATTDPRGWINITTVRVKLWKRNLALERFPIAAEFVLEHP